MMLKLDCREILSVEMDTVQALQNMKNCINTQCRQFVFVSLIECHKSAVRTHIREYLISRLYFKHFWSSVYALIFQPEDIIFAIRGQYSSYSNSSCRKNRFNSEGGGVQLHSIIRPAIFYLSCRPPSL